MAPRIFISYAREYEGFARKLATSLSTDGASVWLDVKDIPAGMNWSSAIQDGLDTADLMIVVITPESMASQNVEHEWQYFFDEKKPVIPILLVPVEKPHYQLRRSQYIDFHQEDYDTAYQKLLTELTAKGVRLWSSLTNSPSSDVPQVQHKSKAPKREVGTNHRSSLRTMIRVLINPKVAIPLIVALIGLVGVVFPELFSAIREDRFIAATGTAQAQLSATALASQTSIAVIPTGVTPSALPSETLLSTEAPTQTYTFSPSAIPTDILPVSTTSAPTETLLPTDTSFPTNSPTFTSSFVEPKATSFPILRVDPFSGHEYALVPAGNLGESFVNEFWIDILEVTNRQFAEFLNAKSNRGLNGEKYLNETGAGIHIRLSQGQWQVDTDFEDYPVVQATWYGAQGYCQWDRVGARLPFAVEWRKAAVWSPLTTISTTYPWGNELPTVNRGNFGGTWNGPTAVGNFGDVNQSAVGAYDMFGNVWEWVADGSGNNRLRLGGYWNSEFHQLSINLEERAPMTSSSSNTGFRCVRDVAPPG